MAQEGIKVMSIYINMKYIQQKSIEIQGKINNSTT